MFTTPQANPQHQQIQLQLQQQIQQQAQQQQQLQQQQQQPAAVSSTAAASAAAAVTSTSTTNPAVQFFTPEVKPVQLFAQPTQQIIQTVDAHGNLIQQVSQLICC